MSLGEGGGEGGLHQRHSEVLVFFEDLASVYELCDVLSLSGSEHRKPREKPEGRQEAFKPLRRLRAL